MARWLDIDLSDRLHPDWRSAILGIVASIPLLLGLRWTLETEVASVRRLVAVVQDQLGPLLAPRSRGELALLAVLAGTAEEILFRGVMQVGLARWLPDGLALILSGAAFGLAHFLTPMYALLAALAGVYLGALFLLQGNLLAPIVAHAVYDFIALTYLGRRYRASFNLE